MIVCMIDVNNKLIVAKINTDPSFYPPGTYVEPVAQEGFVIVPVPEELCWQCIKNEVTQDENGNWIFSENLEQKEQFWNALRQRRNELLSASDWTQLRDVQSSVDWSVYRQALRDLPSFTTDPTKPSWPVPPL